MTFDITNEKGAGWNINNTGWSFMLGAAVEHGWEPAGTVLYRPSGIHPEQIAVEAGELTFILAVGAGDIALGFHQAIRSEEIEPDWGGYYTSNDGQIITAEDASNMAMALSKSLQEETDENWKGYTKELIDILKEGSCRIN